MKYLRIIFSILLIPVALSFIVEFLKISVELLAKVSIDTVPFWIGLFGYFIFQVIFSKPLQTYVFGHELTHAIFGLLSGAKIKSFKVSTGGGSVSLTKTTLFIALSPYFIPIYTVILIAIYWILSRFWNLEAFNLYFLFAIGFTIAFHISLTYYAISQGQSDLKQFGVFFSLIFVLIVNCIVLSFVFKIVLPDQINLKSYLNDSAKGILTIWQTLYIFGNQLWISFQQTK
ncbi:MAG: hypothetical protein NT145_04310 [Elusimicrobia bacterium]|nr:hypothetical protein [Elusimicrobiota bacterium]